MAVMNWCVASFAVPWIQNQQLYGELDWRTFAACLMTRVLRQWRLPPPPAQSSLPDPPLLSPALLSCLVFPLSCPILSPLLPSLLSSHLFLLFLCCLPFHPLILNSFIQPFHISPFVSLLSSEFCLLILWLFYCSCNFFSHHKGGNKEFRCLALCTNFLDRQLAKSNREYFSLWHFITFQ